MRKEIIDNPISDYFSAKRKRYNLDKDETIKKLKVEIEGKYIGLSENQKLLVASHIGILPECEILINDITDINYMDITRDAGPWKGATSLYLTVKEYLRDTDNKSQYEKIIRLLVKNGADPTIPCPHFGNRPETVEELINRVVPNEKEKRTLLMLLEYMPEMKLTRN